MSEVIVHKKIVVSAEDKVTSVVEQTNQALSNLEQRLASLGLKVRNSTVEAGDAFQKLKADINDVPNEKNIKANADTDQAQDKVKQFSNAVDQLKKDQPVIKPKTDTDEPTRKLGLFRKAIDGTREAGGRLRDFVAGGLITNAITGISSSLEVWAKQGFNAAKAGAEVAERWKNLGMTQTEVKETGAAVKELKENSDMSGAAVGNLVTRFYGMTNSVEQATTLAKGVGSIADELKLSQPAADAFANGLTRIESSGKVTTQSLGRLERAAPGITSALQKASGMSKQAFDDLLSSGKMTSDQFNDILVAASKNWDETSKEWSKSPDNALHHIQVSWDDTKKALMAPLVSVAGSGLGALSDSLDKLQPLFTRAGQGLADLATKLAKWLTPQHATDLAKIVGDLGKMAMIMGKGAWKAFSIIIEAIAKPFELIGNHGDKSADAFDKLADALDAISKNKMAMRVLEGIGMLLATQFAYGKLFKVASALFNINGALGKISGIKFSGHLFGDLFTNLSRLSKTKINPKNWFSGSLFSRSGQEAGSHWYSGFTSKIKNSSSAFKNLFIGAPKQASAAGDLAGGNFITRFAAKTRASRFTELGRGMAGKLGAGISIGLSVIDFARGLTPSFKGDRWNMIGKGAGGLIGAGIGEFFFGPAGAAIGSSIGQVVGGWLGKAAHKGFDFMRDVFKGKITFKGMEDGFKNTLSKIGKWSQDAWKSIKAWWNEDPTSSSKSSSSHKSKQPSEKVVKSLGGNHYSKQDIANVKAMNKAITDYTSSLKALKAAIKKNDPTKQLNGMNKRLDKSIKSWDKLASPIKKIGKSFDSFTSFNKAMKKDDAFSKLNKDLQNLDKTTKHNNLPQFLKKLSNQLKKDNLIKELDKMNSSLNRDAGYWKNLAKPIKQAADSFKVMQKALKDMSGKHNPMDKLNSSIITLTKTVRKYQFGKLLAQQMTVADKSMSGKHSFVGKFTSVTKKIISDLRSFKNNFNKNWKNAWTNLDVYPSRALNSVRSTVSSRLNSVESRERGFTSSFLSGWRRWNSSVVSEMSSAFNKLPGIAQRAMSGIISRLNRGISAINGVISSFGGDKKLSAVHYARGTSASGVSGHPGGLAMVNDGDGPHKQELVWQPSNGWQIFSGLNRLVHLEAGAQVLSGERSHHILSAMKVPHYAEGTLSEDEQDKLAEQFISNPIQASKNLVLKVTDWRSKVPAIADLGKATAIGFSRGIANVLKDLLGIVKEPRNGDWTPVIKSAAHLLHFNIAGWQVAKLLRQIQTESGGREVITNHWDSNAKAGHPSQGLLQFVPSTFYTWAVGKYRDINKGFDQILAAINALNHGGEGGWGNIGNGHGWANGGRLTSLDFGAVADNPEHDEFVINPYNGSSLALMNEAWSTMSSHHPEWRMPINTGFNQQVLALMQSAVEKLDSIDIHPIVDVATVAKASNQYNAQNLSIMKGGQ